MADIRVIEILAKAGIQYVRGLRCLLDPAFAGISKTDADWLVSRVS